MAKRNVSLMIVMIVLAYSLYNFYFFSIDDAAASVSKGSSRSKIVDDLASMESLKLNYQNQFQSTATMESTSSSSGSGSEIDNSRNTPPRPPGDDDDDEESLSSSSSTTTKPKIQIPKHLKKLLPRKTYTVVGLESSGTHFVSKILMNALGTGKFREAGFNGRGAKKSRQGEEEGYVTVQHMSIPTGPGRCETSEIPQIQKLVLPGACTPRNNDTTFLSTCLELAREANITSSIRDGGGGSGVEKIKYPKRYFYDIVANKEWYESKGVEQIIVIVLRDQTVAGKGRMNSGYCRNTTLLANEEEVGTKIITRAIHKYILCDDDAFHDEHGRRRYFGDERRKLAASTTLPHGNNVFLVSYESIMKLKQVYIQMMYKAMGIDSDFMPDIHDGNQKYINTTLKYDVAAQNHYEAKAREERHQKSKTRAEASLAADKSPRQERKHRSRRQQQRKDSSTTE